MLLNVSKDIYPFESKFIDLTDLKYHYIDEGQGDPVVMLHGNPTWSIYFRDLVKELSKNFRCIVPDHIGCGFSEKPDDSRYDYTLEQRVNDLEMLLQYLKIYDNVTLIMHDWGAMIGMAYAMKNPDSIKKLVILNSFAFHFPIEKKLPLNMRILRNTEMGGAIARHFNLFTSASSLFGCTRKIMEPELRQAYIAPYDSWENRIAIQRFLQDIPLEEEHQTFDLVSEIQENIKDFNNIPSMIFWGMKDNLFDKDFLDIWTELLPSAKVHKYEDCGHYILEDASEDVIKKIKEFLK
jgi:pimeloyl-ACP methyl ester carboxylesterase